MNALEAASLVMIPSGYEDGTLGSLKPLDGSGDFTFSRGSNISATRVNADGNIEKGYENLLEQSNQFDTTWATYNTSVTSGQSGFDGSNDAWLLNKSGTDGRVFQNISFSGVTTFSIYAKANTNSWIRLFFNTISVSVFFDLVNGVKGNSSGSGLIDSQIQSIGNGWYRCSVTMNGSGSACRVYPAEANTTSATSGSIYIQDAMINQGLVAYPYVETTTAPVAGGILEDMPRLDYSNGSCPSLLLEPSRTNLITHSEYIEGGDYSSTASFAYNTHISPEGVQNALTLTDNSTSGIEQVEYRPAHTAGTSYVFSMFVKKDSDTTRFPEIFFRIGGGITQEITTQINTSTGAKIDSILNGDVSSEVIDFSDDYWRVIIKAGDEVSDGNTFIRLRIRPAAGDVFGVQNPTTTGSIVTYGWQLEQDATYPTSYIPTYGVSQTRLGDDATADISSLIDTSGSVAYFEGTIQDLTGATESFRDVFALTGAGGISLRIERRVSNQYYIQRSSATINSGDDFNSYFDASMNDDTIKIAFKFSSTQLKLFYNGSLMQTFNGSYNFGFTAFKFRDGATGNNIINRNNKVLAFPTALSDEACIELTTI